MFNLAFFFIGKISVTLLNNDLPQRKRGQTTLNGHMTSLLGVRFVINDNFIYAISFCVVMFSHKSKFHVEPSVWMK